MSGKEKIAALKREKIAALKADNPTLCWEPNEDLTHVCIKPAEHSDHHGWDDTLRVGDVLGREIEGGYDGYCAGEWGRDSYRIKRVEAVGPDWVLVREEGTHQVYVWQGDPNDLARHKIPKETWTWD